MEAFSKGFQAPNNPFPNRVPGVRVLAAFGPCSHKHVVLQGVHAAKQSTPRKHQEGIPVLELNTIPMQKQRDSVWLPFFFQSHGMAIQAIITSGFDTFPKLFQLTFSKMAHLFKKLWMVFSKTSKNQMRKENCSIFLCFFGSFGIYTAHWYMERVWHGNMFAKSMHDLLVHITFLGPPIPCFCQGNQFNMVCFVLQS